MKCSILVGGLLLVSLMAACSRTVDCADPSLAVKFNGYDSADLAVYTILTCEKGSGFSRILFKPRDGYGFQAWSELRCRYLRLRYHEFARDSTRDHGYRIQIGYDYLIQVPSTGHEFRPEETSLGEPRREVRKDDYAYCTSAYNYRLNGIRFSTPVSDRPRASAYSIILLER